MPGARVNGNNLGEARQNAIANAPSAVIAGDLPKELFQGGTAEQNTQAEADHGKVCRSSRRRNKMSQTPDHGLDTPGYAVDDDGMTRAQMRQKSAARQAAAAKRMRDAHGRFISRAAK